MKALHFSETLSVSGGEYVVTDPTVSRPCAQFVEDIANREEQCVAFGLITMEQAAANIVLQTLYISPCTPNEAERALYSLE